MPIASRVYQPPAITWNGPKKRLPPQQIPDQPGNYNSTLLPWPVYLYLQNMHPQRFREDDKSWIARVKPLLELERAKLMPRSTADFRDAIRAGALNRGLRVINPLYGDEAEKKRQDRRALTISTNPWHDEESFQPRGSEVITTVPTKKEAGFEKAMVDWLADMSEVATPANGAIFWNGINENKLAAHITEWNKSLRPNEVHFGQLEATTDVRHVNGKFVWVKDNAFHKYGEKVSEMLGMGATGHVSAVVRWGLNTTSILTNTELPRMLALMEKDILEGKKPKMTDLTIIVIEPLGLTDRVKCYVNSDILKAPVFDKTDPKQRFAATADDCTKLGEVGSWVAQDGVFLGKKIAPSSPQFLEYLAGRPRNPSPATPRILRDLDDIVHQKILRT